MKQLVIWFALIVVRLAWTLLPQASYIHPDEFFQTVEVVAGDVFNTSIVRTWEFTSTFPLRSITVNKILFHPSFRLLDHLSTAGIVTLSGYSVLIASRLVMFVLSLWVDFCVFKICKLIGAQGVKAALILASSYVTMTFQCHSFSNSVETVVVISDFLLLILMIKHKFERETSVKKDKRKETTPSEIYAELISDSSPDGFELRHKTAFARARRRVHSSESENTEANVVETKGNSYNQCSYSECVNPDSLCYIYIVLFSILTVVGIFNRPTFVLFGFLLFFWWNDIYNTDRLYYRYFLIMFISSAITTIVISVFEILYFCDNLQKLYENPILTFRYITPINFFLYNMSPSNVSEHGHHPFYVHLLVNMPMLLGPLLFPLWQNIFSRIYNYYFRRIEKDIPENLSVKQDKNNAIDMFSSNSQSSDSKDKTVSQKPVSVELRLQHNIKNNILFFIYLPVIILSFIPHQELRFLIPVVPLAVISVTVVRKNLVGMGIFFWMLFVCFNIFMGIVFGIFHQAGVVPCLMGLEGLTKVDMNSNNSGAKINLAFSHTYMPPKHVLLDHGDHINLIDFKGKPIDHVCSCFQNMENSLTDQTRHDCHGLSGKIAYLAIPGSVVEEMRSHCGQFIYLELVEKFFPHVSFEDLPELRKIRTLGNLYDQMSLHLYKVKLL
ncbi:GPI mannosyltransferase 4-like [Mya arenaria]|uniref:GPI mannosyltransferase 4-like n=1 Tax=Mya arenaria TaxID=6604 RepID=UPI0022E137D1|nr:GPI mannosyltransferase 4-like [Mya arenaria]XP_052784104.1 GPI mannosyltransferase 4-like [Mya arenaria]